MSGTIPLSMTQQFDVYGKPLAGGQLYIIQVGTVSTPQDAFVDSGLTIEQPYPMTLDAAGRIPQFFLADGSVKIRLQDKNGVVQLTSDNVMVIGASSGGGGGAVVDPTQLIQTGNMILRYGVGVLAGYVRANGLTIGSSTSGAVELHDLSAQALFLHLWAADPTLAVSGGRTTALNDWNSNKQLALPDWRGYAISGLDDMGNAAANRYQGWLSSPTTLGATGGVPSKALATGNLPPHTHSGTTYAMGANITHGHTVAGGVIGGTINSNIPGGSGLIAPINAGGASGNILINDANIDHTHTFDTNANPAFVATPFGVFGPRKLCTLYLKL